MSQRDLNFVFAKHLSKLIALCVVCSFVSCAGSDQPESRRKIVKTKDAPSDEAYLADMTEAATQDAADVTSAVKVSATPKTDIGGAGLAKLATRAIEMADSDESESLSMDEFLNFLDRLRSEYRSRLMFRPTEAQKAKVTAKLEAKFQEFAGSDELMDHYELESLLVSIAPRVAILRNIGRGTMQPPR
jgi:hypothetical protein